MRSCHNGSLNGQLSWVLLRDMDPCCFHPTSLHFSGNLHLCTVPSNRQFRDIPADQDSPWWCPWCGVLDLSYRLVLEFLWQENNSFYWTCLLLDFSSVAYIFYCRQCQYKAWVVINCQAKFNISSNYSKCMNFNPKICFVADDNCDERIFKLEQPCYLRLCRGRPHGQLYPWYLFDELLWLPFLGGTLQNFSVAS